MASNLIDNRQIRIFISSTFDDMQAERNMLIKHVFPQLRVEASKRNVTLMTVDLRWGITAEEYQNGKILEICLNEIENSYPFFIGILGDRYGWQPGTDQIKKNTNLKERYPWIISDLASGLSVTEMEMQFGVLRKKADTNATFFIKKSSRNNLYSESTDAQNKLHRLKQEIRTNKRYPWYEYTDAREIAEHVRKDFTAVLDKYFPEKEVTPLDAERNAQRSVLSDLCMSYVPVEENFTALNHFLTSPESRQFCITGQSGLGKSALVANWIKRLENNSRYTVIYHFVGTSDTGVYYENILHRLVDEICDRFEIEITDEEKKKKSTDLVSDVITRIPSEKELIIIIDAINQINDNDYAKQLSWLPSLPSNVKLVVSTLPTDDTYAAITRRSFQIHTLQPLQRNNREKMVSQYLRRFGKTLTPGQMSRIIDNGVTKNTLVLKTLLNQLILFGRYEDLDDRIDYYLNAETIPAFFQKVLHRSEEDYDRALIRHALSLIALSRNGMSEAELIDITRCTPIQWSQIYCAFVSHFNFKNGLINFAHTYLKEAVINRYLSDEEHNNTLRSEIAKYFENSDTPRALDELPYQYYLIGDNVKLHDFLMNLEHFKYLIDKDKFELCKYWQKLKKDEEHGYDLREYLEQIENSNIKDKDKSSLFTNIGSFANEYITDLDLSLTCNNYALKIILNLGDEGNNDTAKIYESIGDTYHSMGLYKKALEYHNKALSINNEIYGETNDDSTEFHNQIGADYDAMGLVNNALKHYEKAVAILVDLKKESCSLIATLYNNTGCIYLDKGQYAMAIELFKRALKIRLQLNGETSTDTAYLYSNLGRTYSAMGQNKKGLFYFEKTLNIRKILYGELHYEVAESYCNIGDYYHKIGLYEKAIEYKDKAVTISSKLLGENNPRTAIIYDRIGYTLRSMGQYEKALEYYKKGLNIRKKILGDNNPDTATCLNHIGSIYDALGKYEESIKFNTKALEINLKLFGEMYPNTSIIYNDLALTYHSMGMYGRSIEYYKKAINIDIELYGEINQESATVYDNIGDVYKSMGLYDKALANIKKAYNIRLEIFGEMHPLTAISYNNMGSISLSLGQYNKALEYYNKSLEIGLQLFGEMNIETANSYNRIGIAYELKRNYDKALEYKNKALEIKLKLLGEMNLETSMSYDHIAETFNSMGKYDKALEYRKKTLKIQIHLLGKLNSYSASSYDGIGCIYESMGKYDRALEYYTKGLEIRQDLFGENNFYTGASYNNIAGVYKKMGNYDKAIECYNKDLKIQSTIYKSTIPDTAISYENIGNAYELMKKYDVALEYYKKALNIRLQLLGEINSDTAISYSNIGLTHYYLNQYEKALEYYIKALNIYLHVQEENTPETATIYGNIADSYCSLGLRVKALEYYEKAYGIKSKIYESDYDSIYSLIDTKRRLGKYEESIELCTKYEVKCNQETKAAIHLMWGISLFYLERYDEALIMHTKTFDEKKQSFGEEATSTINALDWIGRDYLMLKQYDRAVSILEQVYEINKSVITFKYLAIAYGKSGDKEKAATMLEQGLKQIEDCDKSKYANKGNYLYDYAVYVYEEGDLNKALKLAEEGLHFMNLYYEDYNHPHKERLVKLIEEIKNK